MTVNEFINALSPKAKQIIYNYEYINNNRNTIIINFTDSRSQVNLSHQDRYIIEIKRNPILYNMEYDLLHEFYHCVQIDQGFPSVDHTLSKYQKLATIISSAVLDLDVNERLVKVGYPLNYFYLKRSLDEIRKIILISNNDSSVNQEIHEITNYMYICTKIAFIRINYNNQNEVDQLLQILKNNAIDCFKTQSIIYNTIVKTGYNTPQKSYKTLKTLIRELKLNDYIHISR